MKRSSLHKLAVALPGLAAIATAICACVSGDSVKQSSGTPAVVEPAIYVSTLGDDNASGDSADKPVATIATGIQRALGCSPAPCPVHIAEGEYSGTIELVNGVDLLGGYAEGFGERDPAAHEVVVTSAEPRAVIAKDITFATNLEGLTIRGATYDANKDGQSTYAFWVNGATEALRLASVHVEAGNAASGADGAAGEAATCNALGGQGGTAFDCGGSAGATGTADSDPVSGGDGGPGGDSNCPNACPLIGNDGISDGAQGAPGNGGGPGIGGAVATDQDGGFSGGLWAGALGEPGQRGFHGTGGGGGGSGGTKRIKACFGCGTILGGRGADGGLGGCGGGGGAPGGAGGGSFGILLLNAGITLEDVTVTAGQGGPGGRGGDGALGQVGASPAAGPEGAGSAHCGAIDYHSGGGGPGGIGGNGGRGGGGSGGVGGVSIGIALVGTSSTHDLGRVAVELGAAGKGGEGGLGGANAQPGFDGVVVDRAEFADGG